MRMAVFESRKSSCGCRAIMSIKIYAALIKSAYHWNELLSLGADEDGRF